MHPTNQDHATLSAAERVYRHVKTAILDGGYAGGQLLTEGEIAAVVEVSRTPVREALLRLEVEGLVRLYPKKGALVVPVSGAEADAILEARALLETWAIPHAVSRRGDLVPDLRGAVAAMVERRSEGDVAGFSAADRGFHERIVSAAGNDVLARFYRSLRERQLCINTATLRVDSARMDTAIADHTALVDALEAGDEAAFDRLTRSHLDRAVALSRGVR